MAKRKAGLHKNVSSIFDGVSVPNAKKDELTKSSTQGGTEDKTRVEQTAELSSALSSVPSKNKPLPESKPLPPEKPFAQHVPLLEKKPATAGIEKPAQAQLSRPPAEPAKSPKKPKITLLKNNKKSLRKFVSKISSRKKGRNSSKLSPKQLKRQKVLLVLMPILLVVLMVMFLSKFKSNPTAANQTVTNGKTVNVSNQGGIEITVQSETDMGVTIDWDIPPEYSKNIRDPMTSTWMKKILQGDSAMMEGEQGLGGDATEAEGDGEGDEEETIYVDEIIVISSILFGTEGSSVVIDNEILYEGDSVYGAVIKKIDKNIVLFEKDGVIFQKSLPR